MSINLSMLSKFQPARPEPIFSTYLPDALFELLSTFENESITSVTLKLIVLDAFFVFGLFLLDFGSCSQLELSESRPVVVKRSITTLAKKLHAKENSTVTPAYVCSNLKLQLKLRNYLNFRVLNH